MRELTQREALAAAVQQAASEPDRVDDRRRDPTARQALDRTVDEPDVEAGVVRSERGVAREREEPSDRELRPGSASQLGVAEAREARDRGRKRDARLDERLERVGDLERLHPNRADLADPVATRGEPGGLEVEHDDLGVLDQRVDAALVRQSNPRAAPREARVAVDDVREEGMGERDGRALEREESARGVLGRDGAAARVDELNETVGRVEGELHAIHRIRTYVRLQGQKKGRTTLCAQCGPPQSSVLESAIRP